jgi:hypothetical protein
MLFSYLINYSRGTVARKGRAKLLGPQKDLAIEYSELVFGSEIRENNPQRQ